MSKVKIVALWGLQVLLALLFLAAGIPKLAGNPNWIARFARYGYPDNFYRLVGVVEVLGALALLIPRTAAYSAAVLIVVMIGATITHALHSEAFRVPITLVLAILLGIVAYARRPNFKRPPGEFPRS